MGTDPGHRPCDASGCLGAGYEVSRTIYRYRTGCRTSDLGTLLGRGAGRIPRCAGTIYGGLLEAMHTLAPRIAPELDGRAHVLVPLESFMLASPAEHGFDPASA
jgi:hypothetical protein